MPDRVKAFELALAKLDGRSKEVVKTHRSAGHHHRYNSDGTAIHKSLLLPWH